MSLCSPSMQFKKVHFPDSSNAVIIPVKLPVISHHLVFPVHTEISPVIEGFWACSVSIHPRSTISVILLSEIGNFKNQMKLNCVPQTSLGASACVPFYQESAAPSCVLWTRLSSKQLASAPAGSRASVLPGGSHLSCSGLQGQRIRFLLRLGLLVPTGPSFLPCFLPCSTQNHFPECLASRLCQAQSHLGWPCKAAVGGTGNSVICSRLILSWSFPIACEWCYTYPHIHMTLGRKKIPHPSLHHGPCQSCPQVFSPFSVGL